MTALTMSLRTLLGVPADETTPGELAAIRGHSLPDYVQDVDIGGLIAWILIGVRLFSGSTPPTWREISKEAKRLILALCMERTGGNISRVAELMESSRRAIRDGLKNSGLYEQVPASSGGTEIRRF